MHEAERCLFQISRCFFYSRASKHRCGVVHDEIHMTSRLSELCHTTNAEIPFQVPGRGSGDGPVTLTAGFTNDVSVSLLYFMSDATTSFKRTGEVKN